MITSVFSVYKTVLIKDTEPSKPETPQDCFLSEREFITKSLTLTILRLSFASVLATFSICGTMPLRVTESGE